MNATMFIQAILSGILFGFVYALISVGLSLIVGMMGLVNFAHGDFLMLGMYISFWGFTCFRIDPVFSIPIAGTLLFFYGVFVHKTVIRRLLGKPPLSRVFATFGLSIIMASTAQFFFSSDFRLITDATLVSGKIRLGDIFIPKTQIFAAFVSCAAFLIIYWIMMKTEVGKAMRATAEDRDAAALVGIDSEKMYTLAWGLSGASVGVAGAVLSNIFYVFPTVGTVFSFTAMVAVALGGFGSIPGALVGGILIALIQMLGGLLIDPVFKMVLVFITYFCVLVIRPQGLFGKR